MCMASKLTTHPDFVLVFLCFLFIEREKKHHINREKKSRRILRFIWLFDIAAFISYIHIYKRYSVCVHAFNHYYR